VLTGAAAVRARAAAPPANPAHFYRTRQGYRVRATLSAAYPDDRAMARSYVTYLDSLPHGAELGHLSIFIAPLGEVQLDCGGGTDVLACYVPSQRTMYVPGDDTQAIGGVSTKFVVAHEFGHHIAAFRRNDPFDRIYSRYGGTLAFGPKYWSSEEFVCAHAETDYFPGAEDATLYESNPGEAWAETYAHLRYPDVPWGYAPALAPTKASLRAARRDVLHPWTRYGVRTFRGALGPHKRRRTVHFDLRLDGRLSVRLSGPSKANYDLRLRSGPNAARTHRAGSQDHIDYLAACRATPVAHVAVTVIRRSGRGRFRLRVRYAG
jgi:hypothetical protein